MDSSVLAIVALAVALLPLFFLIRISGRIGETNDLLRHMLEQNGHQDDDPKR